MNEKSEVITERIGIIFTKRPKNLARSTRFLQPFYSALHLQRLFFFFQFLENTEEQKKILNIKKKFLHNSNPKF